MCVRVSVYKTEQERESICSSYVEGFITIIIYLKIQFIRQFIKTYIKPNECHFIIKKIQK